VHPPTPENKYPAAPEDAHPAIYLAGESREDIGLQQLKSLPALRHRVCI
jgi:hypothetical protein